MRGLGYPVQGSGRWRRLLSSSGAPRGTEHLVEALRRHGDAIDDPIEAAAYGSLRSTLERFDSELAAVPTSGPLSDHARVMLDLLTRYQPPSATRPLQRG
jgi:hypothetical protein